MNRRTKLKNTLNKSLFFLSGFFSVMLTKVQLVAAQTTDVFGEIAPPPGVDQYNQEADIGVIVFASRIINFGAIVAGIWTLINIITAGWIYLTANDSSAHEKVGNKILNSVIGLAIIALSYTIAGIISLLIFGDATFILNPEIESVGTNVRSGMPPWAP